MNDSRGVFYIQNQLWGKSIDTFECISNDRSQKHQTAKDHAGAKNKYYTARQEYGACSLSPAKAVDSLHRHYLKYKRVNGKTKRDHACTNPHVWDHTKKNEQG